MHRITADKHRATCFLSLLCTKLLLDISWLCISLLEQQQSLCSSRCNSGAVFWPHAAQCCEKHSLLPSRNQEKIKYIAEMVDCSIIRKSCNCSLCILFSMKKAVKCFRPWCHSNLNISQDREFIQLCKKAKQTALCGYSNTTSTPSWRSMAGVQSGAHWTTTWLS